MLTRPWPGSRFGVDPDASLWPRGSTTVLSQGDAGARNLDAYIQDTIDVSTTRVKLAINFCAYGETDPVGRFSSLDYASISECLAAIERGGSHVRGISLNIALIPNRAVNPLEVMRRGMSAAEQSGSPVLFGATSTSTSSSLLLLR